jgi:signal peptidase
MILLGVEKTETNINVENAPSKGYKTVKFLQTVITYLIAVCIVIAALLFAVNKSPQKSLFGFRYYTVLTPSMEPAYSVGDLVIVKLTNADNISVGDVITFNPSSDSDAYLTHRVTEKLTDYEGTGVTCFRTKGDANDTEDSFLIDSSRVIGTVSLGIPKLGYVIRFVQLKWYIVIPLVVMIVVLFKLLKIYFTDEAPAPQQDDLTQQENLV